MPSRTAPAPVDAPRARTGVGAIGAAWVSSGIPPQTSLQGSGAALTLFSPALSTLAVRLAVGRSRRVCATWVTTLVSSCVACVAGQFCSGGELQTCPGASISAALSCDASDCSCNAGCSSALCKACTVGSRSYKVTAGSTACMLVAANSSRGWQQPQTPATLKAVPCSCRQPDAEKGGSRVVEAVEARVVPVVSARDNKVNGGPNSAELHQAKAAAAAAKVVDDNKSPDMYSSTPSIAITTRVWNTDTPTDVKILSTSTIIDVKGWA
eukprot:2003647-Rhodomonas_salina.2